jgi:hypothetical protein
MRLGIEVHLGGLGESTGGFSSWLRLMVEEREAPSSMSQWGWPRGVSKVHPLAFARREAQLGFASEMVSAALFSHSDHG